MKKNEIILGLLLVAQSTVTFADKTTDISGIWSSATVQGDFKFLSSHLDKLQWQMANQNGIRDDSSAGQRLNESVLLGQLNYQLNDNVSLGLGYVHDLIYPLNKRSYQENRPYQDIVWNQAVANFNLTLRTRFEERMNQTSGDTGYRAKQLTQISHDLPFLDGLSGYLSDEVYFYLNQTNFGKKGFSENRFSAGLSYQFTSQIGLDLGYLEQYIDNKTGNNLLINNLQTNLRYRF